MSYVLSVKSWRVLSEQREKSKRTKRDLVKWRDKGMSKKVFDFGRSILKKTKYPDVFFDNPELDGVYYDEPASLPQTPPILQLLDMFLPLCLTFKIDEHFYTICITNDGHGRPVKPGEKPFVDIGKIRFEVSRQS